MSFLISRFFRHKYLRLHKFPSSVRFVSNIPLSEEFPGVPPQKYEPFITEKVATSTLQNGLKLASIFTKEPISALGLFVNAGCRFENPKNAGVSFFLRHMGFKSNAQLSQLRFVREIESLGATFNVLATRDNLIFYSEFPSERAPNLANILSSVVLPRLPEYEIRDEKKVVKLQSEEIISNPRTYVFELLHQEAYRNKGLGQPLYLPSYNESNLDTEEIQQYVANHYASERMTLVSTGGIEHKNLVAYAQEWFSSIRKGNSSNADPSPYVGGEIRLPDAGETHLIIGFEGLGLGSNAKDLLALGIIQHLLGGGKTVNRGPEYVKSGTSRLFRSVVEKNSEWMKESSAFNLNHSDSGLFGVYAAADRGHVPELVKSISNELLGMKGTISTEEMDRAKASLRADILFSTETKTGLLHYTGRLISAGLPPQTPTEFLSNLDSVTAQDIKRIASKVLSSEPTLVITGDVYNTPTRAQISSYVSGK